MELRLEQTATSAIVYDADYVQQPEPEWFDAAHWHRIGAVNQTAPGRGSTLMLDTRFGPLAMRRYLRGGWAARFSQDRYLFTGFERSRPLREMRILAACVQLGLPVPHPIAAYCLRHGLFYSAVLLTKRIMPAFPLAEQLDQPGGVEPDWWRTGRCIRRFHAAGVVHPDLNARNILLGEHGGGRDDIYLIDFDRAFFRHGSNRLFRANLSRLHRSLEKTWPAGSRGDMDTCWQQLMKGYNSGI